MTTFEKLKEVAAFLRKAGIEDAAKEAELIITEVLKINKTELYTYSFNISASLSESIDILTTRRCMGEPLQYIIGHVDFYGLKINVGKGVLIPRPETELLVEETIKAVWSVKCRVSSVKREVSSADCQVSSDGQELSLITSQPSLKILDLCTGSGCIALAIAKHFPDAIVYGVDFSEKAIEYAIKNARENNILNVQFVVGDLFESLPVCYFDCIVSNPPYIKSTEIQNLQREIRDYEPIEALLGGENGLDFYRRILRESPVFLKKGGVLAMELGVNQSSDIVKLALDSGFKNVRLVKDYAGIKRIFIGEMV